MINNGCVVLLTSANKDQANVMTLAWQMPVSVKPPLIAIGVAATHLSNELIRKTEEFVINVPNGGLLKKVHACGHVSGRICDKFKEYGLTLLPAKQIKPPLIAECIGHLECGVIDVFRTGDHDVFIGEVQTAAAEKVLFDNYWVSEERTQLIHHLGGNFYLVNGARVEVK